MSYSKEISKTDDSSKKFIIECLKGDNTYGFDLDSIYNVNGTWYVFEYLKCDNSYMTPHTSNPKYYPWNYKKFESLYKIKEKLNGHLFLVNYSDKKEDYDKVKLMEVLGFNYEKLQEYHNTKKTPCEYLELKEKKMTKEEFSEWLRKLNKSAKK